MRVICAIKSPVDLERRALIYMAARPEDLVEINNVFHGPTEWVVADGAKSLASGNYEITAPLTAAQMQADLDFVAGKIAAVHPATRNGNTDDVDKALAAARTRLSQPLERHDFWLLLNSVLIALHDSHSSLGALGSGEMLDLPVRWLEDGIIVSSDTAALRRGDRVLTLGGRDEKQLLAAMRSIIPAETDGWVRHRAATMLRDQVVLELLGIVGDGPVNVTIDRGGERKQVAVGPGRTANRVRPRRPWVGYTIEAEHDLAILTLDKCTNNAEYQRVVREFFEDVARQGITRIAVDLRENGGGNSSVTNEFLRYLDIDQFADYSAEVRVTADVIAQRGVEGPPRYDAYGPQRKRNKRVDRPAAFDGKLFVLTSNRTFSSGSWFATVLRDNGLAEVVGEATGNSPSAFGDILTFTAPESGFTFTLSYKKFVRPDRSRDPAEHLPPDRHVPLTRKSMIDGTDPVLELLRK
jgi:C-terminal processing protease CtpA/Prc